MVLAPEIGFLVLVTFFGILIFSVMGRQVSEGIVSWLKNAGRVAAFVAGPVGAISVQLTRWITHYAGGIFADVERLTVTWFSAVYQYLDLVITNALEWPLWLWKVQRWLLFVEIPKIVKIAAHAPTSVTTTITKRLQPIVRTIVKLPKLTKAQATALIAAAVATYIHPYLAMLRWIKAHFHALTVAIPRALPIPQVPTFPNIWKRIRRLEHRITPAAIAAAVALAIGRLGIGFIRCGNFRKAGKRVCGIDTHLLDSLLLDTLAVFSVVSVVEFAHGLRSIEDEAVGILHHLIREFPAPPSTTSG